MAQKSTHTTAYRLLRERLVAARHAAGMNQAELAASLGRPQSFIAKVEGGERRIDVVELLKIASAVNLDVAKLLTALRKAL
jgi:transcriptional regulator with XRE-family HTH domain